MKIGATLVLVAGVFGALAFWRNRDEVVQLARRDRERARLKADEERETDEAALVESIAEIDETRVSDVESLAGDVDLNDALNLLRDGTSEAPTD